jgi:hypothetical protein
VGVAIMLGLQHLISWSFFSQKIKSNVFRLVVESMTLKRKLNIIYYTLGTLLFSYMLVQRLSLGHLSASSSFNVPYWLLYLAVFIIPITLFIVQIFKHDQWSSSLIIFLIVALVSVEVYDQYEFYYSRNVMPNVSGPVPYPTFFELTKHYAPIVVILLVSISLAPRKVNPIQASNNKHQKVSNELP